MCLNKKTNAFINQSFTMKKIGKPVGESFPHYFQRYIDQVPEDGNLVANLKAIQAETKLLINGLSEEKLLYRYAEGKWSIKEILVHIADTERIFTYRALRFARADSTPLPGFNENDYAPHSKADKRKINAILKEMATIRAASLSFIDSLDNKMLKRTGSASNNIMSVKTLVNLIYGHHKHHLNILKERYL
jgi:uncharacterized damage-inducible protein DinB